MRISDWSSDVCSSDLRQEPGLGLLLHTPDQYARDVRGEAIRHFRFAGLVGVEAVLPGSPAATAGVRSDDTLLGIGAVRFKPADRQAKAGPAALIDATRAVLALPPARPLTLRLRRDGVGPDRSVTPIPRSEEHTSALQSLMRTPYAV